MLYIAHRKYGVIAAVKYRASFCQMCYSQLP